MTPSERAAKWHKVEDLFERATQIPSSDREAWLQEACAGDDGLLREVQSLLNHDVRTIEEKLQSRVRGGVEALFEESDQDRKSTRLNSSH